MVVTRVSHSYLLIELGPICNSMADSMWFKNCEERSILKSYNGGLKHLLVWALLIVYAHEPPINAQTGALSGARVLSFGPSLHQHASSEGSPEPSLFDSWILPKSHAMLIFTDMRYFKMFPFNRNV